MGILYLQKKGASFLMLDCLLIVTLLAGFGLIGLLLKWCNRQIESQE